MVLHVRRLPEHSEKQGNSSLRGDSMKLCSSRGLLGVCLKCHNSPHRLGIRKFMSI